MAILDVPGSFSDIIGFGVVSRVFPVKRSSKWGNAAATLLLFGGAGALFIYGVWNTYTLVQRHGPAVITTNLGPFLVLAAILFLIGIFTLWQTVSNWKKSAVLYQEGFAYCDRKGVITCRWDEIESIKAAITKHYTNGIYTGTTHAYTVEKKDGTRLILNDSLLKVEELAEKVRECSFPLIYERCSALYNSGHPQNFGPVTISRGEGIVVGKKCFPWSEVDSVSIQRGLISIAKKGGGWFSGASANASTVPNLEVMLSIVNQVVGVITPAK